MKGSRVKRPLLCLDPEGALISNAVSQIPRPGLKTFLERASVSCDLMLFTSVTAKRVDEIKRTLVEEEVVPLWFENFPVIHPEGTVKYRESCGDDNAMLLDDQSAVIAPGEESWWIPISEYLPPYPDDERELMVAICEVDSRIVDI